jgi:hypothetical protein
MNPIFAPTASISPPGAAFRPETGLFPLKTTPPFAAGAALDAAGASLSRPRAALRRAAVPPFGKGAMVLPTFTALALPAGVTAAIPGTLTHRRCPHREDET